MSTTLLRTIWWHRPCKNLNGVIRRSIARYESSISQTATDPKKRNSISNTVKDTSSLTQAASTAIPALHKFGKTLGVITSRTGQIVSLLQQQVPTAIYYARVGSELSKLVFYGQKMVPPPMSTFQSYFQQIIQKLRNPSSLLASAPVRNPQEIYHRVRNLSISDLATGAVLLAEILGFFTVGEIIGRFKLIGYRCESTHHH